MKSSFILLIVTFVFSAFCLGDDEFVPYPVRNIDRQSDKFSKIIATVSAQYYERQLKQVDMHNVEILQSIGEQTYRVSVGTDSYVLKIPGEAIYPDGEVLSLPVLKTEEVFQYTPVLGALTTLRVLTIGKTPSRLSENEVVLRLQAGEKFPIVMGSKVIKCKPCGGLGSIGGVDSKTCRNCGGSRKEKVANLFMVVW